MKPTCQIDGCDSPVFVKARGWCAKHYHRWYRTGDPLKVIYVRANGTPEERWHAKVNKTETCWLWIGGIDKRGYGQFDVIIDGKHKNVRAHRWGYQLLVRDLSDDETLDHLCRVHACVRPDHLDPVLHAENVGRGSAGSHNAAKTHCPQGHPYDDKNTFKAKAGRGCRACRRESARLSMQRLRATFPKVVLNGDKTHCLRGHEFSPENTYATPQGGRSCRECGRLRNRESLARRRASVRAT